MSAVIMAIVGFAAGFVLDGLIARLARQPYERGEMDEDALEPGDEQGAAPLQLSSETGAVDLPRALTTASMYRTALVVLVTALAFAAVGWRFEDDPLHVAIVAAYAAVLIICTGTDIVAFRVPNIVTYPAILCAIAIGMVMPDANRLNVLAGGMLTGMTFLIMYIATRGGMGMGDVKLSFFVGFALGLKFGALAMLATALAGGVVAGFLLLFRRAGRRDPMPYGPFIALGMFYIMLMEGTAFQSFGE